MLRTLDPEGTRALKIPTLKPYLPLLLGTFAQACVVVGWGRGMALLLTGAGGEVEGLDGDVAVGVDGLRGLGL